VHSTICYDIKQFFNGEMRDDISDDSDTKIKKVRLEYKDEDMVIYFTGYFARLEQELDVDTLNVEKLLDSIPCHASAVHAREYCMLC